MNKKLKTLRVILLGILILVVLIVAAVNLFADRAVRVGIESAATRNLNVEVGVSDVDLSIISGKIVLQNLLIGNPPAYQHDNLLELKSAETEVDAKSLLSNVVNIKEIKLNGVVLAIANAVVEEGIGVLPTDIVGTITSTLGKTIDLGTRIIEGKEDIGREITEGLRNLLKPRQKE